MTESTGSQRHLPWAHCLNTRDLGGLSTDDGRMVQPGRLVRSDTLSRLSAAGEKQLLEYGIRTVIDLRHPAEAAEDSYRLMHGGRDIAYLNLPMEKFYAHVSAKIMQAGSRGEVYCIIADHYPDLIAEIFKKIRRSQPGGILIHCHSGKDRTGMISALALRLAGVPLHSVVQDYALSQKHLTAADDSNPDEANDKGSGDFWSRPTAVPEMMVMFLAHLDRRYNGVGEYLRQAGVSTADLDAITDFLLTP